MGKSKASGGFTNNTSGPKAINTTRGVVILQAGETLGDEHEVPDADRAAIEATGFLDGDGQASAPDPATVRQAVTPMGTGSSQPAGAATAEELADANSKEQLLEIAQTERVEGLASDATKADIAAAIIANRSK